jgi:TonB family protein
MHKVSWIVLGVAVACGGGNKKAAEEPVNERPPTRTPIASQDGDEEDEEPDDVGVEGLLGRLDRGEIQPVIEASWDAVQRCYTSSVKKLRYIGGVVELRFRVNRDGTVKHVHVARGVLGAWPVEKCVLDLARAMTFPKPRGGEAVFSFPIEFPARGRAVAMEEERVRGELEPQLAALSKCHEPGGAESEEPVGNLPDRIDVTLYVGRGGVVTSAGFSTDGEAPIPDAWADCAHDEMVSWKLTDPRGMIWKATASVTP